MRPRGRRRPAGRTQVPIVQAPAPVRAARVEPTVVRLTAERGVVDAPWGFPLVAIAHVWPEPRNDHQWVRVSWPLDRSTRRFVAPIDLQIGHVLEIINEAATAHYGWVADVDQNRFVLAPACDATAAVVSARYAVEVWHAAELATVDAVWRSRIDRIRRLRDDPI